MSDTTGWLGGGLGPCGRRTASVTSPADLPQENPSKHPIIILKDVPFSHLQAILEFMYAGEVNVGQDQLPDLLKTAEKLKVKGLIDINKM